MEILGLMSGSSLDGIDLALCEFSGFERDFKWRIKRAETIAFSAKWVDRLRNLPDASAREFAQADYDFGNLLGKVCSRFLAGHKPAYIASHGHTVFHYPDKKMTCQLGNGALIAAETGVHVVNDFRSMDIGLGGHGAPIVSMFDQYVLGDYAMSVNLGGIVNITFNTPEKVIAYDIGPCNQLLNYLASKKGFVYDKEGEIAAKGQVKNDLLKSLLSHPYFDLDSPKTLDNSYVSGQFIPILEKFDFVVEDKMRTVIELIALSMYQSFKTTCKPVSGKKYSMLLAGGGANNKFLVDVIKEMMTEIECVVPDSVFIDFKEAMMIAFLAYLRINNKINTLSSVTGAMRDSIGGAIYKLV